MKQFWKSGQFQGCFDVLSFKVVSLFLLQSILKLSKTRFDSSESILSFGWVSGQSKLPSIPTWNWTQKLDSALSSVLITMWYTFWILLQMPSIAHVLLWKLAKWVMKSQIGATLTVVLQRFGLVQVQKIFFCKFQTWMCIQFGDLTKCWMPESGASKTWLKISEMWLSEAFNGS